MFIFCNYLVPRLFVPLETVHPGRKVWFGIPPHLNGSLRNEKKRGEVNSCSIFQDAVTLGKIGYKLTSGQGIDGLMAGRSPGGILP